MTFLGFDDRNFVSGSRRKPSVHLAVNVFDKKSFSICRSYETFNGNEFSVFPFNTCVTNFAHTPGNFPNRISKRFLHEPYDCVRYIVNALTAPAEFPNLSAVWSFFVVFIIPVIHVTRTERKRLFSYALPLHTVQRKMSTARNTIMIVEQFRHRGNPSSSTPKYFVYAYRYWQRAGHH